ncbi:sigma-70 family RNA polymerase sigma factor [Sorangium sp. So ce1078]|uniref:sigma-70 family RNA polymerase sigma factor n=1 Tax=Sorangium sp. So ce1078 TaxID=3133329 RepID=UPI003F62F7A2
MNQRIDPAGLFDVRYAAFLETVRHLRVKLHRYCTRMTGSALDGEDVMQEALFEAYRKIEQLDDSAALRPWLFRIAHNRCIDFLRNRQVREHAEANYSEDDAPLFVEHAIADLAIERLVILLPPKERACVLLKDVFDHSLEEIADLVDSTVGGVKSALNRGRAKLAALRPGPIAASEPRSDPELAKLLHRYVELFNRRDWDGVRALTSADAQLRVSDCFKGLLVDSPYFREYDRSQTPWKMEVGEVDGETALIVLTPSETGWRSSYPVRIRASGGVIHHIADYHACPWIVQAAASVRVLATGAPPPSPPV